MTNITLVDGHVPNYVDPPTKQPLVMGVQIGMTATAVLCVALRLYTRKVIRNVFGAEDWVLIGAMSLAIVATICTCLGCTATLALFCPRTRALMKSRCAWWDWITYLGREAGCESQTQCPGQFGELFSILLKDG